MLREFRCVDAANLLSAIHREHGVGRTMLKHIKAFLSGAFSYAKNQGVLDGVNPVRDAMIPKRAAAPQETHAATPDEVLAIMDGLQKAGEQKARAAVALMFLRVCVPAKLAECVGKITTGSVYLCGAVFGAPGPLRPRLRVAPNLFL